ncbi:MAG: hypothetical protein D8M58_19245 [Calditrichaeota bacterium]|nr:MAG: hypothetical protein DWQ03_21925 [Calditrichota bacterium]MBL1207548.1 hypothetical protein [Calditrichota bacterium]NOG47380.1 S8 family serine peptidase [Calditrichota bacterium]
MIKHFIPLLFLVFCQVAIASISDNVANNEQNYVAGHFIVKFKKIANNKTDNAKKIVISKYNVQKSEKVFKAMQNETVAQKLNLHNVFVMKTDISADIAKIVKDLNTNPDIEYAEPVYINKMDDTIPDDPSYNLLHHLPQVKAPQAWDSGYGSSDIIIAILDSGVDWDHEDLANIIWSNDDEISGNGSDDDENGFIDDIRGWDFVDGITDLATGEDGSDEDNNPMDFGGHGTHVSGIAAAQTNNAIGVSSVSSGVTIMPLRIGWRDSNGDGFVRSDFAASAYIYAADNGAHITNQSSGNSGQAIVDAAFYAFLNGVLVVESAGNGNAITPSALGLQDWVISVASVNKSDVKASYSSFGSYVKVSAPGGDFNPGIYSTIVYPSDLYSGKYTYFNGTSMASPLVSSVAGLVKSHNPEMSVLDLFDIVVQTADNIDDKNPSYIGKLGSGRVNAFRALTEEIQTFWPNLSVDSIKVIENEPKFGLGNGRLDPGETVSYQVFIKNQWREATNVAATLTAIEDWPIEITDGSDNISSIGSVLATPNNTAMISFTIKAKDNAFPSFADLNLNLSMDNGYNKDIKLQVAVSPTVLLVADHEGDVLAEANLEHYVDFFNRHNISFELFTKIGSNLSLEKMKQFSSVFWSCEWTFPSLDDSDRLLLGDYLDGGGKLFISGQDLAWDLAENQLSSSGGQSLTFLNTYLKAEYKADGNGPNSLTGVVDDPIGDGIEFNTYLDKRDGDQQFPDEILPLDGAVAVLNYPSGNNGAIRYDDEYKLVYFSFGGLESIVENNAKLAIAEKTLLWLIGLDISHNPIPDLETQEAITVTAEIASIDTTINAVKLFWNTDSLPPFEVVEMSNTSGNTWQADIPQRTTDSDIYYFIQAYLNDESVSPAGNNSFYAGADIFPPSVEVLSQPYWNTINNAKANGYLFEVRATDNIGIETENVKMIWQVNSNTENTIIMDATTNDDEYSAILDYGMTLQKNDKISYYFQATDLSVNANIANSDTFSFIIDTVEVIDGFENGTSKWNIGDGWGISNLKNSGSHSIDDSPTGNYENNSNNSLTYNYSFDLSSYQSAWLEYFVRFDIEDGKDTCYVEVSIDNENWDIVDSMTGRELPRFKQRLNVLDGYAGFDNVTVRFRMKTDADGQAGGINIDDISMSVSYDIRTGIEVVDRIVPKDFSLDQNFPNPFNPETTLQFELPKKAKVTISIYNTFGQRITELASNEDFLPGKYRIKWKAENNHGAKLASGLYIYNLKAVTEDGSSRSFTKKMLLIK